jgi:PPP family 3-phenylpropionic acid transporter
MGAGRKDDAERRLSLATASLYALGGVQVAYFPLWLGARGLDGAQIATILAACPAIRIVSNLFGARLGDLRGDYGRLIALYAGAAAAIFAALGFAHGYAALFVGVVALSFAQAPVAALLDGLVLGEARRRRDCGLPQLHFSSVRGWGSASVLVFMLASGPFARDLPPDALIWIMTAIAAFSAAAGGFLLRDFKAESVERGAASAPMEPLRQPALVAAVILCAALAQGSNGFLTVFGSLHWAAQGYDANFISLAWAASIFAEVLFFLAAGRWFSAERRAPFFLAIGCAGAAARWALMANDPPAAGIILAQAMTPVSSAAIALGAAHLIAELGGKSYTARVHGWLAAACGASLSASLYVSGPLEAAYGQRGYLAMAAMAGASLVAAAAVVLAARRGALDEGGRTRAARSVPESEPVP